MTIQIKVDIYVTSKVNWKYIRFHHYSNVPKGKGIEGKKQMASWMIHLRVAQGLMEKLNIENEREFIMGNIAPDSGEPNEDWSAYTPSGEISHFQKTDSAGIKEVHEEKYIERYFTKELQSTYTRSQYEFYLGYLTHLLTDKLWARDIVYSAMDRFSDLYNQDKGKFIWTLKRDWYDMDHLYLRKNPDFKAFKIYASSEGFVNNYLDFFSEKAFDNRRKYITEFYINGSKDVLERPMYLSMKELDEFVDKSIEEIIEYLRGNQIC